MPNHEVTKSTAEIKSVAKQSKYKLVLLDTISILFWSYAIIKIFVFDFDSYLIKNYVPSFEPLIKFKLLIFLLIISFFILIRKKWSLIGDLLYIAFFPFVIFFWKIPVVFLKIRSWNLFFIFLTYVIMTLRSAKFNFVTFTLVLTCIVTIFTTNKGLFLWPAIIILLCLALAVILHRIISVYSGSPILKYTSDAVSFLLDKGKATFSLEEEVKLLPVEKMDQPQLQKWSTALQLSVIFCRGCAFLTRRLRDFQRSKYSTIVYVLNFLSLLIFTIIIFTFIYYGLYKTNPEFYTATNTQFFDFFFFSFNKSIFNSISEIQAIAMFPKIITMLQQFISVCFGSFVILLIISVNDEKSSREVDEVIKKIEDSEKSMEENIHEQFSMTIVDAIKQLEKYSAGMIKFIYLLSKDVEKE